MSDPPASETFTKIINVLQYETPILGLRVHKQALQI